MLKSLEFNIDMPYSFDNIKGFRSLFSKNILNARSSQMDFKTEDYFIGEPEGEEVDKLNKRYGKRGKIKTSKRRGRKTNRLAYLGHDYQ